MRYIPNATKHKWVICFPPLILAINICEAVFRDFEAYSFHAFAGEKINNLRVMSGPWNIMNGIAGILNILLICGWTGIYISKEKSKDMMYRIWTGSISSDMIFGTLHIHITVFQTILYTVV